MGIHYVNILSKEERKINKQAFYAALICLSIYYCFTVLEEFNMVTVLLVFFNQTTTD